jgi:hypothetical protein
VRLLLKSRDDVPLDAAVSVFLVDNQQRKFNTRDSYPPSDFSYSAAWLPGEIHLLDITVPVPTDVAPGQYSLAFELYDFRNGERVKMIGERARGPGNSAILQQFKVVMSPASPPANPVAASFAGLVALDGYDVAVEPGADGSANQLAVDLRWQAQQTPLQDFHSFIHLYDETGKLVNQHDGPLGGLAYPSSIWEAGESVVDRHTIGLVPRMSPGIYSLRAGLYLPSTGQRLRIEDGGDTVELGKVVVDVGSTGQLLRIMPTNRPR